MTHDSGSTPPATNGTWPAPDGGERLAGADIHAQLERLLASAPLRGSERLRRFLRLVVTDTLAGRGDRLKEYVLGVEALDRPSSFDPRADPVVRVEARRLRAKLADYYDGDGRGEPIVIDLPKGSYVATFHRRAPASAVAMPPTPPDPTAAGIGAGTADGTSASLAPPVAVGGVGGVAGWRRYARPALLAAVALVLMAAAYWRAVPGVRPPPASPTIAILPFTNASTDHANEFFCFGLVEDLTTALAQMPGLRVVARTSAMQFTRAQDVREIGRRLHADYVVEGSVRKEGDRLRITAQLIGAGDGAHVWAAAYDRPVSDLLTTQAEIARAIASALGSRVFPADAAWQLMALDAETQELLAKGRYFLGVVGKHGPEQALGYLKQAIERAPGFAPVHAAAAAAYAKIALARTAPRAEEIAMAKAAAQRALELDPSLADAHALLAWIAFFYDWNWTDAERGFERALAINPSSALARHRYSLLLMSAGRFDEALAMSRQAVELDPLSPLVASNRAMIFLCARRFDEALTQAHTALELEPAGFLTHIYAGSSHAMVGRLDDAIAAYQRALAAAPGDPDAAASLARALALLGRRAEAEALLADLRNPARSEPASSYQLAFLLAALGDDDAALAALHVSRQRHETELVYLAVDPLFDQLRSDPRFEPFLGSLGFGK
ncbi:MAG: tetratricopeptide repeat protein [Vicinamibacterales bacterium]|nr:tetratricopeptide repeat protein [Vicinamibacterales bacterium]